MANLASCGDNVKIFGVPSYNLIHSYEPFRGHTKIKTISWSKTGQFLASVPHKGQVEIASINDNGIQKTYTIRNFECPTVAVFQNTSKKNLALGSAKGSVAIYDLKSKHFNKYLDSSKSLLTHLVFNSNDSYLAAGCNNGDIVVYSLTKNVKSSTIIINENSSMSALKFHPVHRAHLAGGDDHGTVAVWDINVKKPKLFFPLVHTSPCTDVAFSPINTTLVTSVGYDKTFNCYDIVSNAKVISTKMDHALLSLDILYSGNIVALGSKVGSIYILDLRYYDKVLKTIAAHETEVKTVLFKSLNMEKTSDVHVSPSKSVELESKDNITSSPRLNDSLLAMANQQSIDVENEELSNSNLAENSAGSSFLDAMGISGPVTDDSIENENVSFLENSSLKSKHLSSIQNTENHSTPICDKSLQNISEKITPQLNQSSTETSTKMVESDCSTKTATHEPNIDILTAINRISLSFNNRSDEMLHGVHDANVKLDDIVEKLRLEFIYLRMGICKQFIEQNYKIETMHKELLNEIYKLREENANLRMQIKTSDDFMHNSLIHDL